MAYPYRECDKDGKPTGRWDCPSCYQKYDPNSRDNLIKSTLNCRSDNKNPDLNNTKGDNTQELACVLYGLEDLNKKYDNYKSPIDCIDKSGSLHQVQGRSLSCNNKGWHYWDFSWLEREWKKDYKDIILFCLSEDRKIIEEIYKIPFEAEIKEKRKSITISKNRLRSSKTLYWYEQYRVTDEEELKRANKIYQTILSHDN